MPSSERMPCKKAAIYLLRDSYRKFSVYLSKEELAQHTFSFAWDIYNFSPIGKKVRLWKPKKLNFGYVASVGFATTRRCLRFLVYLFIYSFSMTPIAKLSFPVCEEDGECLFCERLERLLCNRYLCISRQVNSHATVPVCCIMLTSDLATNINVIGWNFLLPLSNRNVSSSVAEHLQVPTSLFVCNLPVLLRIL